MGMNARAILYRGVVFPEGYEFPWDDYDEEDWYLYDVVGYKEPFRLYDDDGEYYNGIKPPEEKIDRWYERKRQAERENPLPVIFERAGTDGCEYTIIASWLEEAEWDGHEVEVPSTEELKEKDAALVKFLNEHCKPRNEYDEAPPFEPRWRLSAYYG